MCKRAPMSAMAAVFAALTLGLNGGVAGWAPVQAQENAKLPDVPPTHWAYQAVQDLANAGLVLGYPDGKFLGNRTLSRYEMATIVKRIVDNLAQRSQPAQPNDPPAAPAVTPAQLAEVRRLVDELKAELTVIGTDLAAVKTQLQTVNDSIEGLNAVAAGQRLELDTLNAARTQVRLDGYIQARFTERATGDPVRAPENVNQDTTRGVTGNRSTFQVRRARFNIRGDVGERGAYRLQLDARTAPTVGADEITVKEAYVTVKNFPFQLQGGAGGGVGDNRAFATADLTLGQQVTPFGYYLQFSSSDREAPERYIGFSDTGGGLFPNQDYDKGVSLNGLLVGRLQYQLGLYNGNGVATNDLGRRKDFIGRIGVPLTASWDLGVSGYDGEGPNTGTPVGPTTPPGATVVPATPASGVATVLNTRRRVRSLIGVDTQYYLSGGLFPDGGALKLEYVKGKGGLNGNNAGATVPNNLRAYIDAADVEAYYIQGSYNLGKRATFALGYDYFCRNADPADSGPLSTITVGGQAQRVSKGNFVEERLQGGVLYFLEANTRVRLWYETPLNYPNLPGANEVAGRSGFYTAEIQVRF